MSRLQQMQFEKENNDELYEALVLEREMYIARQKMKRKKKARERRMLLSSMLFCVTCTTMVFCFLIANDVEKPSSYGTKYASQEDNYIVKTKNDKNDTINSPAVSETDGYGHIEYSDESKV